MPIQELVSKGFEIEHKARTWKNRVKGMKIIFFGIIIWIVALILFIKEIKGTGIISVIGLVIIIFGIAAIKFASHTGPRKLKFRRYIKK